MMKKRLIASACLVAFCGCGSLDDPAELGPDDVILLSVADTLLDANGEDFTVITARVKGAVEPATKVTFRTDRGSFLGTENKKELEVTVAAGTATATLVADTLQGKALVTATVEGITDEEEVTFVAIYPARLIVAPDRQTAPADGQTAVNLQVTPVPGATRPTRNVPVELMAFDSLNSPIPSFNRVQTYNGTAPLPFRLTSEFTGLVKILFQMGPIRSDTVRITFTPKPEGS